MMFLWKGVVLMEVAHVGRMFCAGAGEMGTAFVWLVVVLCVRWGGRSLNCGLFGSMLFGVMNLDSVEAFRRCGHEQRHSNAFDLSGNSAHWAEGSIQGIRSTPSSLPGNHPGGICIHFNREGWGHLGVRVWMGTMAG